MDELLLLVDHVQQSLQHAQRQPGGFAEEGSRTFDVDCSLVRQVGEGRRCQAHGTRQQRIVKQPFVVDPLQHGLARAAQRKTRKLGVQIVGSLPKIVGAQRLVDVDHLLNDVTTACDDDHQHAHSAQRHELDPIEDRRFVSRSDGERHTA